MEHYIIFYLWYDDAPYDEFNDVQHYLSRSIEGRNIVRPLGLGSSHVSRFRPAKLYLTMLHTNQRKRAIYAGLIPRGLTILQPSIE